MESPYNFRRATTGQTPFAVIWKESQGALRDAELSPFRISSSSTHYTTVRYGLTINDTIRLPSPQSPIASISHPLINMLNDTTATSCPSTASSIETTFSLEEINALGAGVEGVDGDEQGVSAVNNVVAGRSEFSCLHAKGQWDVLTSTLLRQTMYLIPWPSINGAYSAPPHSPTGSSVWNVYH